MKNKLSLALVALMSIEVSLFAFTPVFGGEDLYTLTSPELLSGSGSAAGGPVSNIVPASIVLNPALTAQEQQYTINLSYLALINASKSSDADKAFGTGFQIGAIIPTRYFVYSGSVQGIFAGFDRMDLGNSFNLHLGASKNINDHLDVGLNLYGGVFTGNSYGTDWDLGADLGVLYTFDNMGILKSPRLGIAVLNMGKPVLKYNARNIKGTTDNTSYPGIFTPRVAFASTLLETSNVSLGFSTDLMFPTFQNVIADLALGMEINKMIGIDLAWEVLDIKEYVNGAKLKWPSLGINAKFTINTGAISKLSEDWKKSEICPSVAATNLYSGIIAVAGGASIQLGQKDTSSPEIILWGESQEDVSGESAETSEVSE